MNISFDNNYYSAGNNGELIELAQSPSKIKNIIEVMNEYEFENFEIKEDPEISTNDQLHVKAYSTSLMNELIFVFDKYGLHKVKYPTGQTLYKNEDTALFHQPTFSDMIIAFTHSMIEVNGEKYARSVETYRKENIRLLKRHLYEQESERVNTQKTQKLIQLNEKILNVIQKVSKTNSEDEKQ